jgi:hypothetical protein
MRSCKVGNIYVHVTEYCLFLPLIISLCKDAPVCNGVFILSTTRDALSRILSEKLVSDDDIRILRCNFPSLHRALESYFTWKDGDKITGDAGIFGMKQYTGLDKVLRRLIGQFDKYAAFAKADPGLNPMKEGGPTREKQDFGNGIVFPGLSSYRPLGNYKAPLRSNVPTLRGVSSLSAIDNTDDNCTKDYGKAHADLTPGIMVFCCIHGFVLGKA